MRVQTRHPLYQFMQPVHLQLHGFCLGSVAGEVAPKKEAAMSSIRGLTDQVFHSLNVKVCTFQSNFVALTGYRRLTVTYHGWSKTFSFTLWVPT